MGHRQIVGIGLIDLSSGLFIIEYYSDSLEVILSHLSTTLMNVIVDGHCLWPLNYLLEFFAAWEKRPANLTSVVYQWCCTISKAVARLGPGEIPTSRRARLNFIYDLRVREPLTLDGWTPHWPRESFFSTVGSGCDSVRLDSTSHRTHSCQPVVTFLNYEDLLRTSLKAGFRLAGPGHDQPAIHLGHTSHNNQIFEIAFSSDDEVVADVVCTWIADGGVAPPGWFVRYFTKRLENRNSFSRRLQWASTCCIERIWRSELEVSALETVHLLNRLKVNVDHVTDNGKWVRLLIFAIRSTTGRESLSSHNWRSLDRPTSDSGLYERFVSRDVEVMKSLEEAQDWGRLEVWMVLYSVPVFHKAPMET